MYAFEYNYISEYIHRWILNKLTNINVNILISPVLHLSYWSYLLLVILNSLYLLSQTHTNTHTTQHTIARVIWHRGCILHWDGPSNSLVVISSLAISGGIVSFIGGGALCERLCVCVLHTQPFTYTHTQPGGEGEVKGCHTGHGWSYTLHWSYTYHVSHDIAQN